MFWEKSRKVVSGFGMQGERMRLYLLVLSAVVAFWGMSLAQAATLDEVRARGHVICGVDDQHYGFAYLNVQGRWRGFEVDFCRALAVTVLGDPDKVRFVSLNAQTRFSALVGKKVDIVLRSATWTYRRDTELGVDFPGIIYYDQLGIVSHKSRKENALSDVDESSICVAYGTTTLNQLEEYIDRTGKNIKLHIFNSREGLNNFFFSGQCALYAADKSALQAILRFIAPNPADYKFLEASLSKEPLGPAVREGDQEWFKIVQWMLQGVIEAEERGITRKTVEARQKDRDPTVRYLLGEEPGFGRALRLRQGWLYDVVRRVGNYGEIFERNLGQGSKLKMERGLNALWQDGGLMYALPVR